MHSSLGKVSTTLLPSTREASKPNIMYIHEYFIACFVCTRIPH